jgi:hypothetical protein
MNIATTKQEGFWRPAKEKLKSGDPRKDFGIDRQPWNLPFPEPSITEWPRDVILDYLGKVERKAGKTLYRGFSVCRLCHKHNGNAEYSYKGWSWPAGYKHYLRDHNVQPTKNFAKFLAREVTTE